jgi:hypothetical protein
LEKAIEDASLILKPKTDAEAKIQDAEAKIAEIDA